MRWLQDERERGADKGGKAGNRNRDGFTSFLRPSTDFNNYHTQLSSLLFFFLKILFYQQCLLLTPLKEMPETRIPSLPFTGTLKRHANILPTNFNHMIILPIHHQLCCYFQSSLLHGWLLCLDSHYNACVPHLFIITMECIYTTFIKSQRNSLMRICMPVKRELPNSQKCVSGVILIHFGEPECQ